MKALVISPGGMGCTFVLRTLRDAGLSCNESGDGDGLKHHPDPLDMRYWEFHPERVVYVWNDPLISILSHHRRGWLGIQRTKLTSSEHGAPDSLDHLWNETVRAGRDVYGIEQHYSMWRMRTPFPTKWLDFRSIDGQRANLADFLGLCADRLDALQMRERAFYDTSNVPEAVLEIYRSLDSRVLSDLDST